MAATTSRSCSASSRAHPGRGDRADRQPRPRGVEAVRRVERGDQRGVPGDDRVGDGQGGGRRADVGHGGQVAAERGGPGDHVRDQAVALGDGGVARGRVGAVEGGERAARLACRGPRPGRPGRTGRPAAASSIGVTSASPAAVTSGRADVPGGWSMPVTMPGRAERDDHDDRPARRAPPSDPAERSRVIRSCSADAWSRCLVRR